MLKVLGLTFRKTAEESTEATAPPALGRAELQNLFQDEFTAHAVIVKSRKAAGVRTASADSESSEFLLRRATGFCREKAGERARSLCLRHGSA
jgi:hypothetical protein